ncbi:MAG: hypothetical protein JWR15_1342 [Prosthecobacter sp.]|nr:hypothetical protein [Prosthecobacter sp.]
MEEPPPNRRWLDLLEDEDINFLKRFLLASGSLKELAEGYKVSYPTVRLRLDRLIQKVHVYDDANAGDQHERQIRALAADGKLDTSTLKTLLSSYRKTQKS